LRGERPRSSRGDYCPPGLAGDLGADLAGREKLSDTARTTSQENIEIVRRIYAEWEKGNLQAGVELFDPEIVFESFMPDSSERVVVHGPDEVDAFMREFLAQWRDYRLFGEEFRQVDGETVVVVGRQTAIGRQSGVAVEDQIFSIWTFRGDNVVQLIFDRGDPRRALEAAGVPE
jgi:ketosteroid isomerase-like protein